MYKNGGGRGVDAGGRLGEGTSLESRNGDSIGKMIQREYQKEYRQQAVEKDIQDKPRSFIWGMEIVLPQTVAGNTRGNLVWWEGFCQSSFSIINLVPC